MLRLGFTFQAAAPTSDWQTSFGASSLTINPGATRSTTLQITSSLTEPPGSYTIVASAIGTKASKFSGSTLASTTASTSVLYNLVSDDTGTPETFTDNFNRPDSPVLGNGWSVGTGSFMIQSLEARNEADSPFSLAVQPGLTGATQTVAASFTATDNNASPRFGVVVRYRNAQNYYYCYRELGGSSALRIARCRTAWKPCSSPSDREPGAGFPLQALVHGERNYADAAHRWRDEGHGGR
jgi:hypothetical protein